MTKDAHNSMIYGTSAITNTIDYVHTGLEIQSKFLLSENTSIDFNAFALDSEIGDESLYDPANPFGLSTGTKLLLLLQMEQNLVLLLEFLVLVSKYMVFLELLHHSVTLQHLQKV